MLKMSPEVENPDMGFLKKGGKHATTGNARKPVSGAAKMVQPGGLPGGYEAQGSKAKPSGNKKGK